MIAGGNARKLARLREILSWYVAMGDLNQEAMAVVEEVHNEEEDHLFSGGKAKYPLEVLLWAMDKADSANPALQRKSAAFKSLTTTPLAPCGGGGVGSYGDVITGLTADADCDSKRQCEPLS